MSSLSRRYRSARPETAGFMPPDLASMGAVPFGAPQRARLSSWLREAAWPREHMEFAELEGYLVALVVWPVDIPAGAWLPAIWGGRGWKVPSTLAERTRYEEFVALIVGFMQNLDHELGRQPALFESSVLRAALGRESAKALQGWGRGFITALTLGSQGLKWRGDSARAAVRAIASSASSPASCHESAVEKVMSAVLSLTQQRASRGPLGPLPASILESRPRESAVS